MDALYSLLLVLALIAAAMAGAHAPTGRNVLMLVLPYAAFTIFLCGFCWRVLRWASVPVPFHIPTTCGQQKSLPWIRAAKIDNPSSGWGVVARMACEVLLFRSLFRNDRAHMAGKRLVLSESRSLWLGSMAFHWSLLVILIRHLRLLIDPVPAWLSGVERVDGFFQVSAPQIYLSDVVLMAAISYLILRRFRDPLVRYVSLFTDYFALFLLLGVAATGILMRYFVRVDVAGVKQFALSVAAFHPQALPALGAVFPAHLVLVCALAAYFPFSKLMHMGGVFLSPTRNLANDSRERRHVNPWNYPVKTHTYAEWEAEFHDKIEAAGIPLEAEHAGTAHSD